MSEITPVSALGGAVFEAPDVSIRECGVVGMVSLRADFSAKATKAAVEAAFGAPPPAVRRFEATTSGGVAWMSPDEALAVCPYGEAETRAAKFRDAMGAAHHMATNVSDARAMFEIKGAGAREAIAKGAPVDLSPEAFGNGDFRRSRLGQAAAAFWVAETPGGPAINLICFRSVADYVLEWLKASAAHGARPGLF